MLRKLINIYWNYIASPEAYLKHFGAKVGKHCLISSKNFGTEPYLITIGDNVQITHGVSIHCHGGGNIMRREIPDFDAFGKVIIQDWAYIGAYSQIMPGVTIGEGAIVAAGSIVTKSVPPYTIVGGNPARTIGKTEDYIERNTQYNVHTKGMTYEQKKKYLLKLSNDKFIKK